MGFQAHSVLVDEVIAPFEVVANESTLDDGKAIVRLLAALPLELT